MKHGPIFLRELSGIKDAAALLSGDISGVAYSGAVIPEHGFFSNLIVDLSSLRIERERLPLLRDHNPAQVAGYVNATIENNQVLISGKLSQKSQWGKEITDLASDGIDWQLSLGIYEGMIEEVVNAEVNGIKLEKATVLRNGLLRENSVVAIGADSGTESQILSQQTGVKAMTKVEMTKDAYAKLACACGGHADDKPEDLATKAQEKADKAKLAGEAAQAEIDEKQAEIDSLKEQIAEKEAEIAKIKEEDEVEARAEKIEQAVKEKNLEFSAEKKKEAAKTKESTDMFLSVIADLKPQSKKIDPKFTKVEQFSTVKDPSKMSKDADSIRLEAKKLVEEKKAPNLIAALDMLQEGK